VTTTTNQPATRSLMSILRSYGYTRETACDIPTETLRGIVDVHMYPCEYLVEMADTPFPVVESLLYMGYALQCTIERYIDTVHCERIVALDGQVHVLGVEQSRHSFTEIVDLAYSFPTLSDLALEYSTDPIVCGILIDSTTYPYSEVQPCA